MAVYDLQTLRTSAEMAATAELAYTDEDGSPRIEPLTPLLTEKEPAFALPYSRIDLADRLEKRPGVSLTFSDSRLARVGWSPLAVEGRVEVVPDPEGDLFLEELLYWELRKFWPSRQLIGSLVLRRDNWWYVPRLILRFTDTDAPRPIERCTEPDHGILAWKTDHSVASDTVRVEDWEAERPAVSPLSPDTTLPSGIPATLLYHDFSVPDREQHATLHLPGRPREQPPHRCAPRRFARAGQATRHYRALAGAEGVGAALPGRAKRSKVGRRVRFWCPCRGLAKNRATYTSSVLALTADSAGITACKRCENVSVNAFGLCDGISDMFKGSNYNLEPRRQWS